MGFIPRLPESAPFASSQRAWLDGYLAGLFGSEETVDRILLAPSTTTAPLAAVEIEEFPWHDPTLLLDERLALAQGKRLERVLMAAMAQLDCGQCGYLCQTYAEAIARGDEKSLSRCAPGGKATARKLKELVGTFRPGSAGKVVSASAASPVPAPKPIQAGSLDKPLDARFCEARPLNHPESEKDTRHVVLAFDTTQSEYEVGDSLGVVARNSPELVAAIIACLGVPRDILVLSPDGIERPAEQALSEACEIRRPSDQAIEVLASRAIDRSESLVLQAMAEGYPGAGPEDADLLDLLQGFPSARPPLSELISALDPLQPRLYSIASSPKNAGGEVHLAVAAVRYQKRARRRLGVASTFLSDRLAPGEPVRAFVRPAHGFRLPPSPDTPIIMIGPGTGIAPFRAFPQERRVVGAPGRNWLVFGNPHRDRDFLFEEELSAYCRDGLLTRLDTAFSRDQESKIYVQHRLLEHAQDLWSWLEEGAHLYVCGDAQRMARDVEAGLTYIVGKEGRMEPAAAKAYLAKLTAEGRYQKDVY
jgi:sulfite reductase (NADPH) flavoprotein alpha-component